MIIVADNLRITLPAIAAAVDRLDPEPVRRMAAACRDAGARAIDINSGPLSRNPAEKMTFLVRTVQESECRCLPEYHRRGGLHLAINSEAGSECTFPAASCNRSPMVWLNPAAFSSRSATSSWPFSRASRAHLR